MKFWEAMKALEEGKKINPVSVCWIKSSKPFETMKQFIEYVKVVPGILYEEEWELYEEPVQTYTFQEMIRNIQMGKKSRRKSWDQCVYSVIWVGWPRTDHGLKDERCFTLADINATDWIVVE